MFRFNKKYFVLTLLIFIAEVLIAVYIHDQWIRPYFGDVLVVILMYSFLKSFFKFPVKETALGVTLFAFVIEFLQLIKIVDILGLGHSMVARTVIGTSFAWIDLLAYMMGLAIILLIEKYRMKPVKI